MSKEKNISILNSKFLEKIRDRIQNDPDIVNTIEEDLSGAPYIKTASSEGSIDNVVYLLDNNANIYLYDDDGDNVLNGAIEGAITAKIEGDNKKYKNCCQIFRILLNHEAEQRAYFPNKFINEPYLKDHKNCYNYTPLKAARANSEVLEMLKFSIEEAEEYYEKCKKDKLKGLKLNPYYKQFLPDTETKQLENLIEQVSQLSIDEDKNKDSLIHRTKRTNNNKGYTLLSTGLIGLETDINNIETEVNKAKANMKKEMKSSMKEMEAVFKTLGLPINKNNNKQKTR